MMCRLTAEEARALRTDETARASVMLRTIEETICRCACLPGCTETGFVWVGENDIVAQLVALALQNAGYSIAWRSERHMLISWARLTAPSEQQEPDASDIVNASRASCAHESDEP